MSWEWKPDESNPALVPAPPPVEERGYRVVGRRTVLGHKPGSKFRATLPLEQEAQLIQAGHIARQDTRSAPTSTQPPAGGKE